MKTRKSILFSVLLMLSAMAYANTYHVAKTGNDNFPGSIQFPVYTVSKAASLAYPGDTVLVHEGVYRERIAPPRGGEKDKPITYLAKQGERVVVKGSDVWNPVWMPVASNPGIYSASLDNVLFGSFNPYMNEIAMFELFTSSSFFNHPSWNKNSDKDIQVKASEKWTLGQLFVNGRQFREVLNLSEVSREEGSWAFLRNENQIVIHFPDSIDRNKSLVELSTRNRIFAPHIRGLGYINVIGFVFEHCANDAICLPHMVRDHPELATGQQGAVSTRSGHHWNIENNVIRLTKTVGLDIGSETTGKTIKDYETESYLTPDKILVGYHNICNNVITDNGIAGIVGISFNQTTIQGNILERNNLLLYNGQQHAAIKVLLIKNCQIINNLVRDNECMGIWLDNQVNDAVVSNNVVLNNRKAGIFYEIAEGPVLIENNVIGNTRNDFTKPQSNGIWLSDASGADIRKNTIFNNGYGIYIRIIPERPARFNESGYSETKNITICDNKITENISGVIAMPYWGLLCKNIKVNTNIFSGNELFTISATGEKIDDQSTNGELQKQLINRLYYEKFKKSPFQVNYSESVITWRIDMHFEEWQKFMGFNGNSFVKY